jgi:hypothetical protein
MLISLLVWGCYLLLNGRRHIWLESVKLITLINDRHRHLSVRPDCFSLWLLFRGFLIHVVIVKAFGSVHVRYIVFWLFFWLKSCLLFVPFIWDQLSLWALVGCNSIIVHLYSTTAFHIALITFVKQLDWPSLETLVLLLELECNFPRVELRPQKAATTSLRSMMTDRSWYESRVCLAKAKTRL